MCVQTGIGFPVTLAQISTVMESSTARISDSRLRRDSRPTTIASRHER